MRTVYYDGNGKPRLVPSFCVFADFLGYRNEIREAIGRGEEDKVFQQFISNIEPEIDNSIYPDARGETRGFPRLWDAKVFTDNIVLGYSLWSGRGEKEFGHAITQLMAFQYAVALKGFFVRGGWAMGNLFINRNTVFGGSLLEAYDLESNSAIYPRIILSDSMKDLVFQHMARYASNPPQCDHLLVDDHGVLFLNYLSEAVLDLEPQWEELRRHGELVSHRLAQHALDNHVLLKYQWLAAYHNFYCGLLSNVSGYDSSILVPGEFPSFGLRQLSHDESPYVLEVLEKHRLWEEKMGKLRNRREE